MSTLNGRNGKSNKNGNSKTSSSPTPVMENLEPISTGEELEQELERSPESTFNSENVPPADTPPVQSEQTQQSAEDLLRQAKSQARQQKEQPSVSPTQSAPEQGGDLATASGEINNAILQAGQNLVESSEQADQELFAAGLEDAIAGGDIMTQGYQAGLLIRYGQGKLKSAQSLREQMGLLRSHTDARNTDVVQNALNQLALNTDLQGEKKDPLGGITQAVSKSKHNGTDGIQLFRKPGTPQS